jgi:hypothetical protein
MDYGEACDAHATGQGLDPITEELTRAGIPHAVDQTGGFVMLVNVPCTEDGSQHLWLEAGWDEAEGMAVGMRYNRGADGMTNCYGMDIGDGHGIPLDRLAEVCRAEWRHEARCSCDGECIDS